MTTFKDLIERHRKTAFKTSDWQKALDEVSETGNTANLYGSALSMLNEKDNYIAELEAIVKWYIKWAEINTPENKLLIEARKTLEQKPATVTA